MISGLGRSPGEGNGNPLQYSCLENPVDKRILVGYNPWGRKELGTTERHTHTQGHAAVLLTVGAMLDSTSLEFTHPAWLALYTR